MSLSASPVAFLRRFSMSAFFFSHSFSGFDLPPPPIHDSSCSFSQTQALSLEPSGTLWLSMVVKKD